MSRYFFIFLASCFGFTIPACFAQSVEELYGLEFPEWDCFQKVESYWRSIDSTQVTDDGSHPLRLQYNNVRTFKSGITEVVSRDCRLLFSRTIILPSKSDKKERCTVSLNCKSEIDSLRFIVIARDKKEAVLYVDTVLIHPNGQWKDYSLSFFQPEARTVNVIIGREGCNEAYTSKSIYLDKINIRFGEEELNRLPITSLVKKRDLRLKRKAIVPLSSQDLSSMKSIRDWKDKKIIALGKSIDGIQDVMQVQIQLMKYLITWENCRLIVMDMPISQCFRWNLYLQGRRSDSFEENLMRELTRSMNNPGVFFKFLQWVRDYNKQTADPVRITGVTGARSSFDYSLITDYLLEYSTELQDSVYYLEALEEGKYADLKNYLEESPLSMTLSKKDFQYLQFLMDEKIEIQNRPLDPYAFLARMPDTTPDEVRRFGKAIDIYLSADQKAVFVAPSIRINKHFPIQDMQIRMRSWEGGLRDLGQSLSKRYGDQYHAVSIQIGERLSLRDSIILGDNHDVLPVDWAPHFPFSFEQAAMDSNIPYFYYPSDQLPDGIGGLNLFTRYPSICNPFCNCYIPLHFDALVFIREAKAIREDRLLHDDFERGLLDEHRSLLKRLKKQKNNL